MAFSGWLGRLLRRGPRPHTVQPARHLRGAIDHVAILDGTASSLLPGRETNAGLTFRLLREVARTRPMVLRYEPGIQWHHWGATLDVIEGRGINLQIERVYGALASRYRPGDRLWLFGFSRGAFAARALAGLIDRVGMLRPEHATERNVRLAWRHYRRNPEARSAVLFRRRFCLPKVDIEMVGVWDTVAALGINFPLLRRLSDVEQGFHSLALGPSVRRGYQALALDETRVAFAPVLWRSDPDWPGEELVQMWFRGAHGDVGGQLGGFAAARPLSNIPLVWMLERAEAAGLPLPEGWQARFPQDPRAPAVGSLRGWGRTFLLRRRREVGRDPSERIHPSVAEARQARIRIPAGSG